MVARVGTVAFQGIEAVPVDVQVMVAPGKMGMSIYGLINLRISTLKMAADLIEALTNFCIETR